jgi:transposase
VAEPRRGWHERLAEVPTERLVFVDESGASTKRTRLYGRCPVGRRLVCPVPQGHYPTTTLIAAVRLEGPCAPWLFEGPMDGELFLAWVRQGLAPILQPKDLVILDNLATHKVAGVRHASEAAGAHLLYLPPYSPDFSPIENLWAKVKAILRALAPRTADRLLQAVATAFDAISPADCRSFFSHAHYAI